MFGLAKTLLQNNLVYNMVHSAAEKYINTLYVNGMTGRVLRMPPSKNKTREILLLYGHHSSLERMFGIAEVLHKHGAITMPDLPGFGGMDSFYKIDQKPTLDNYADYLASLIKLRYKRRRFTVIAMSFSVPLIIRTLQKYPDLARKVDFVVSISGFAHRDDFIFKFREYWGLRTLAYILAKPIAAAIVSKLVLNKHVIKLAYTSVSKRHSKMKDAKTSIELQKRIEFESRLWKINDLRTRASTITMMLTIDVCDQKVATQAYHITATADRYFDHKIVEQHLHVVFNSLELIPSEMGNHAPTIIATAKEALPYIPKRLRQILG
jgi:pimeloyl-ACP methyl ester carboxylesterase